jgi:hypothetical protein
MVSDIIFDLVMSAIVVEVRNLGFDFTRETLTPKALAVLKNEVNSYGKFPFVSSRIIATYPGKIIRSERCSDVAPILKHQAQQLIYCAVTLLLSGLLFFHFLWWSLYVLGLGAVIMVCIAIYVWRDERLTKKNSSISGIRFTGKPIVLLGSKSMRVRGYSKTLGRKSWGEYEIIAGDSEYVVIHIFKEANYLEFIVEHGVL